jgi:hypothetical protein
LSPRFDRHEDETHWSTLGKGARQGSIIVQHHNDRFTSIMDQHMPHWRLHRQELNSAPLGHETWRY